MTEDARPTTHDHRLSTIDYRPPTFPSQLKYLCEQGRSEDRCNTGAAPPL